MFVVPQLQGALKRCEEQQDKIIEAHKTIIKLQAKVIENRAQELTCLKNAVKEELKTVQTTVQIEIKSYSATVSKSCSVALSVKTIQAAVKSVTDKEDRNRNLILILHGVKETASEDLPIKDSLILEEIEEKPLLKDCCRLGMKKLVEELKAKKSEEPDKFFVIRNSKVVSVPRTIG